MCYYYYYHIIIIYICRQCTVEFTVPPYNMIVGRTSFLSAREPLVFEFFNFTQDGFLLIHVLLNFLYYWT